MSIPAERCDRCGLYPPLCGCSGNQSAGYPDDDEQIKEQDVTQSAGRYPESATFSGELSGDMECFCWDGVPEQECETIKNEQQWIKDDHELRERGDRLYPGDVLRFLGCEQGKRYKFTITVEEAG